MPEVVTSHGVLPPANLAPIVNNIGAGAPDLSEQRLKPCENGNVTNDEAQRAVDDLDRGLNEKPDQATTKRYLKSLIRICKAYRVVPTSHLILDTELEWLDDDDAPEAGTNLWPGSYKKSGTTGDPEPVSIKVLSRSLMENDEIKRRLCGEAVMWKRIVHPNILPFFGVTFSNELAVVSPWMENVLEYLDDNEEANPIKLLEESVAGLRYLHNIGLAHGSLRGRHILVDDDGHARLANVGQAKIQFEQGESILGSMTHRGGEAGHFRYLSPEYLADEARRPKSATKEGDAYSMGMAIYEVLTGERPFKGYNDLSVIKAITDGIRPVEPNFSMTRGYTKELWELTANCWKADPKDRPKVGDLLTSLQGAASQWKFRG